MGQISTVSKELERVYCSHSRLHRVLAVAVVLLVLLTWIPIFDMAERPARSPAKDRCSPIPKVWPNAWYWANQWHQLYGECKKSKVGNSTSCCQRDSIAGGKVV